VLKHLDALLINDGEARMLAGQTNLVQAAEAVLGLGPKAVIIKHGEYGATAFFSDRAFPPPTAGMAGITPRPFRAPALPLAEVVDPTGAGDSFCGAYAANRLLGCDPITSVRRATISAALVVGCAGAEAALRLRLPDRINA
jgi:sugar/nucleoside kinase (ribokinase family)